MTSYIDKPGSLENLYEKIRDLKSEFKNVEEKMRSAVEGLKHDETNSGSYPGQFTEKMERRGLGLSPNNLQHCETYVQIPVDRQVGRRGEVLASWTPLPSWNIR